ncbi:glucosidase II beta subunit-like domain-containing protein [Trichoderma austrokoningii]
MMRRLQLSLLAALPLCRAKSPAFSIHEDLQAFPQFEVVFSDHYISEKDAQSLLDYSIEHPTLEADSSQPTISDAGGGSATAKHGHDARYAATTSQSEAPLAYEVMNMPPHRYLCAIPVIEPPSPENQTASELARAEEARELGRAAASGWNLLSQLDDTCLYFMSGWWSYRFCNNREIVQFHALPSTPMGKPPQRDPHAAEYVLGQASLPETSETHSSSNTVADDEKPPAELQVKGDQRYLVQKLEGGTVCDLTGRPRTIEVQYHCVPGMQNDRIGWIKEVTICAYVMVVNTPRLCDDVAFLPPEENKANPITCRLITDDEKQAPPPLIDQHATKFLKTNEPIEEQQEEGGEEEEEEDELLHATDGGETAAAPVTVGGVVVGARKSLSAGDKEGQPPIVLAPPRSYMNAQQAAEQLIKVLVQAASKEDGGKVDRLSKEELEKLNIKPDMVEEMEEEMRRLAGDAGWQLEIVGGVDDDERQLRGWLHEDGEDEGGKGKKKKKKKGDDEGSSEQFFKEEL